MKKYERETIDILLKEEGFTGIKIPTSDNELEIKHTGVGYYLDFKNDTIPLERYVLDRPNISGRLGDNHVGFIAFIENSVFTLECYSHEDELSPECREHDFHADAK